MNSTAGVLRITFGLFLLVVAGWFGFAHRAPWMIALLGLAFTVLYVAGKWHLWRQLWATDGAAGWAKALVSTVPVQLILAGFLYLVGLGLGRLFASRPFADSITQSDVLVVVALTCAGVAVSLVIDRLEGGKGPLHNMSETLQAQVRAAQAEMPSAPVLQDGADFVVLPDVVALDDVLTPYRGAQDATSQAIINVTKHDGSKPVHVPYAANDAAIAAAEARLGLVLPDGLKRLYKIKDGGNTLRDLYVPRVPNPRPVHEDWMAAFGGYEALNGLDKLRSVHDSILDFAYEDETDRFPQGAKQMLILAQWYQETTFLDYRKAGEPRVGIVDFDRVKDFEAPDWDANVLWFDTFDAFIGQLVRIDNGDGRPPKINLPTAKGPSRSHADGFWRYGDAADHGADDALWSVTSQRLGVTLPLEMRPYLAAANGGRTHFCWMPDIAGGAGQPDGLEPFPKGKLNGIHHWITLKELSDRIVFRFGVPPWSEIWPDSDKLVVIAASFDTALMLDYRFEVNPTVLYAHHLDTPDTAERLGLVVDFMRDLRAVRDPNVHEAPIGDIKLSARTASDTQFWMSDSAKGVSRGDIAAHEARLDIELPTRLKNWMQAQNGGQVRFRYLPPLKENPHGYMNPVPTAGEWIDAFPDGIQPMEEWEKLAQWLHSSGQDLGDALKQRGASQYVREEFGDPDKVIVLATGPQRLTLLDPTRDRGKENPTVVQLKFEGGWTETHRSGFIRGACFLARRDAV